MSQNTIPQRQPSRAYTNGQGMSSNSYQFQNTMSQRDMNSPRAYTPNDQGMSSDLPEKYQTEGSLQNNDRKPPPVRIEGKITLDNKTYEFTDVMIMNGDFYINMILEMLDKSTSQADMYINDRLQFYFAPCVRYKKYRYYPGVKPYSGRYDLSLVIKKAPELYETNQKRISSNFWNNAKFIIKETTISIQEFYQMYTGEKLEYYSGGNRKLKSLNRRTRKSKPAVL